MREQRTRQETRDMGDINIRPAEKRDVGRIVELMQNLTITTSAVEAGGASTLPEYEEIFDQIAGDPNHHLLVVEMNGQIVGSADLLIVSNLSHRGLPWAVVENVIVAEHVRRRGIARTLMLHLIDLAKRQRCYKVGLSSNKDRFPAHRMYESLGFKQYGFGYRIYF
jgi:GNAT superfamily N-acetyltransferase